MTGRGDRACHAMNRPVAKVGSRGVAVQRVVAGGASLTRSERAEPVFQVHQSGGDRNFGVMRAEGVTKPFSGDLEPFRPSDPMLNFDAEPTQTAIILLLLVRQFSIPWLLVWKFQVSMLRVVALVRTVPVEPCLLR